MDATDNPDPGHIEDYSDIREENAVHGELYFNTYDVVGGFRNDNKDGAQCSETVCGSESWLSAPAVLCD